VAKPSRHGSPSTKELSSAFSLLVSNHKLPYLNHGLLRLASLGALLNQNTLYSFLTNDIPKSAKNKNT
jgi:hypothetical protein